MDISRIDLNLLVTLEALLLEQNVTKAAARLHLSQPAVSAQLSRLRDLFADPLLIPGQRGMTPTAKAIDLLEPLRKSLNQVRAALTTHQCFDPASAQLTVAIACTDYLQGVVLKRLMVELRQQAPGLRVAAYSLEPAQLEARLASGDLDLALMTPDIAAPALYYRHLFDEDYVLIGRRNHPQLRDGMTLAGYAGLEHVIVSLQGGSFVTPTDQALAALGHSRNVVLSAASFLFVPDMIAASDFVALVPRRLVQDRKAQLKLVDFPLPAEGFAVGMVWHERNHAHPAQRWIRELIAGLKW